MIKFNDKVEILDSFYKGTVGIVVSYNDLHGIPNETNDKRISVRIYAVEVKTRNGSTLTLQLKENEFKVL